MYFNFFKKSSETSLQHHLFQLISILKYLSPKSRFFFSSVIALSCISAISEVIFVSSVVPLLSLLNNTTTSEQYAPILLLPFHGLNKFLNFHNHTILLILFLVAGLTSLTITVFLTWFRAKVISIIGHDLSQLLYSALITQPYLSYLQTPTSEYITLCTVNLYRTILSLASLSSLITSFLLCFVMAFFLLFMNPSLTIFVFFFLILFYATANKMTRSRILHNSREIANLNKAQVSFVQESFSSYRDIALTSHVTNVINDYSHLDKQLRTLTAENSCLSTVTKPIIEKSFLLFVLTLASILSSSGSVSFIPLLGAFSLSALKMLPSAQDCFGSCSNILTFSSDTCAIRSFLIKSYKPFSSDSTLLIRYSTHPSIISSLTPNVDSSRLIEFHNVYFSYGKERPDIVRDLSFRLQSGQSLCLLGPSGSGKSTILDLLVGLVQPIRGHVSYNGTNIHSAQFNLSEYRQEISYCPQSIFLLNKSIRDNILCYSKSPFDPVAFHRATQFATINNFVESLPFGFNTIVGERGVFLSGGQRQRIGIARTLYQNANILILDEATNALDMTTELQILSNLLEYYNDKLVIMVTHRRSLADLCNTVLDLSNYT